MSRSVGPPRKVLMKLLLDVKGTLQGMKVFQVLRKGLPGLGVRSFHVTLQRD